MRFLNGMLVFSALCLGVCVQIALLRNGDFPNPLIFMSCIIGALAALMYEIATVKRFSNSVAALLLVQIMILALALRILFVSKGAALAGYDSYNEYVSLSLTVGENRWDPSVVGTYSSSYPLLYLGGASWGHLIGVDTITVAKWFPISVFPLAILMMFLVARAKYGVFPAILASYGLAFLYISLFFHSTLQRETIAFPFFLMTIWLVGSLIDRAKRSLRFVGLAVMSAAVCVLSHHLTSFILVIFLVILLATSVLRSQRLPNTSGLRTRGALEFVSSHYVLLLMVMVFGYWICLKYTPLKFLTTLITEASTVHPGTGAIIPDTLRYNMLFYGELVFAFIFIVISISAVYRRGKDRTVMDLALLVFSGLIGLVMVLTLEGRLLKTEGFGLGSRFETFVYSGMFVLAGYKAMHDFSNRKSRTVRTYLVAIAIVAFSMLSVMRISPSLYSDDTQSSDVRLLISDQEISAVAWLGLSAESGVNVDDPSIIPSLTLTETGHFGFGLENRSTDYTLYSFTSDTSISLVTNSTNRIYDSGKAWIAMSQ